MRLYVNGVLENSANHTVSLSSNEPLGIGNLPGKTGTSEDEFDGKIDDVRIYNRALSATEVSELHTLEMPPAPTINAHPVNAITTVGSTASFDVNSTGATAYQWYKDCLLYTSPSPRDGLLSRMPSCA